jgi:hypothetical protein
MKPVAYRAVVFSLRESEAGPSNRDKKWPTVC